MMKRSVFHRGLAFFMLAVVVALGCGNSVAEAVSHSVGPYRVEVDVRTSLMFLIPQALINCKLSGKVIKVSASAPGYVAQQKEIGVKPGITVYNAYLRLPDKEKRLDVFDFEYKPIASAFFERDQGGTPVDQYAINLFLPIKSWPHPSPANVIVNQPGYGIPIQNSCEITTREEFYRVRLLIDRRVLDDPNDELFIYVNTAAVIPPASAQRWFETIRRLEAVNPAAAADLARAVFGALPDDQLGDALPESLSRLLALKRRFEALHR